MEPTTHEVDYIKLAAKLEALESLVANLVEDCIEGWEYNAFWREEHHKLRRDDISTLIIPASPTDEAPVA